MVIFVLSIYLVMTRSFCFDFAINFCDSPYPVLNHIHELPYQNNAQKQLSRHGFMIHLNPRRRGVKTRLFYDSSTTKVMDESFPDKDKTIKISSCLDQLKKTAIKANILS